MVGKQPPIALPVAFGIKVVIEESTQQAVLPAFSAQGKVQLIHAVPQGIVQRGGAHHALEGHGGFTHTLLAPGAAQCQCGRMDLRAFLFHHHGGQRFIRSFLYRDKHDGRNTQQNGADHRDQDPGPLFQPAVLMVGQPLTAHRLVTVSSASSIILVNLVCRSSGLSSSFLPMTSLMDRMPSARLPA